MIGTHLAHYQITEQVNNVLRRSALHHAAGPTVGRPSHPDDGSELDLRYKKV